MIIQHDYFRFSVLEGNKRFQFLKTTVGSDYLKDSKPKKIYGYLHCENIEKTSCSIYILNDLLCCYSTDTYVNERNFVNSLKIKFEYEYQGWETFVYDSD